MQSDKPSTTDSKKSQTSSKSLRNFLDEATAHLRTALDQKIELLLTGDERAYREFLQRTALVILPLEHALEAADVTSVVTDWPARRRSDALIGDLRLLRVTVPERQSFNVPGSEARLLGMLYVLEGTRPGAEHLLRIVSNHGSVLIKHATAYLSHGAGESLWQSFLERLEGSHHAHAERDATLAGATLVLTMYDAAFSSI
ncbi:MAG TPA: biliverdin-producing heme oxygenase [Steroidobacteraceae bacterium]|nr:biliverdin-producing heme oxygenase [Steroidobacteraceae bacterium]